MAAPQDMSVTIIGAGIVGICCALSLLEKGIGVRLLDRNAPGSGASMGNAGVISPWSCVPQSMPGLWKNIPRWLASASGPVSIKPSYFPRFIPWGVKFLNSGRREKVEAISRAMSVLTRPNIELYRHFLAGTGQEELLRDSYYVFVSRKELSDFPDGLGWRLRQRIDTPMAAVKPTELREIEPALSKEYRAGVIIKDQARAASPGRLCAVLADKVRLLGGQVQQVSVNGIQPAQDGGWLLHTDRGEESAEKVIIAAGAWSAQLLGTLGIHLPLEAERGYHALFPEPGVVLNNSIFDVDRHVVSSSMEEGLRTAGTAEFAGLDTQPNYDRAKILAEHTRAIVPGLGVEKTEYWMGIRPSFPDSLPCLGAINGHENLYAAFGHSHYGLGMAPMSGRLVAEVVSGSKPNVDMTPYSAERFS